MAADGELVGGADGEAVAVRLKLRNQPQTTGRKLQPVACLTNALSKRNCQKAREKPSSS
jgi:hypothetical protein